MQLASLRALVIVLVTLVSACAIPAPTVVPPGLHSPFTGYSSKLYREDRMWLCRPDLASDECRGDATATEVHRDLSRSVVRSEPAEHPSVDCFYVYPTVDFTLVPANHTDVADKGGAAEATLSQLAPFQGVCSLYVPLYRQVTIGTYVFGGAGAASRAEVAFSDVEDAFLHYMGQYNHGRRIVLIGHSQGADMIVRLLQRRFESDAVMRQRLLVAMTIGGPVEVPEGRVVGGTFEHLPLCTHAGQVGCVVAFQSRPAGGKVGKPAFEPHPGNEIACTNPGALGGTGAHRLARSMFPIDAHTRSSLIGIDGIETPFLLLRQFYTAECTRGPGGYRYLAIAAAPEEHDARVSALDLASDAFNGTLGLHVADFQFAMGDLVDIVARAAGHSR
jgi:hypothetical protein